MKIDEIILGLEEMRATAQYYAGFGHSAAVEVMEAAIQALKQLESPSGAQYPVEHAKASAIIIERRDGRR